MYLGTYAFDDEETNELYSEYHLGRGAFRMCKRGTKYCSWHREMPPFRFWRHICITYDAFRDQYKLYVDGEKVDREKVDRERVENFFVRTQIRSVRGGSRWQMEESAAAGLI